MVTVCDNCGAERSGKFCTVCGQNDRNYLRAVIPVIGDLVATTLDLDSRLWRTLKNLFFKPGFLAEEFSANRRAAYIPPLRLYLVASLTLSFIISFQLRGVDLESVDVDTDDPLVVGGDRSQEEIDEARRRAGLEEVLDPNAEVEAIAESLIGIEEAESVDDVVEQISEGADVIVFDARDAVSSDEPDADAENAFSLEDLKEVLGPESAQKIDVIVERWGPGVVEGVTFDLSEEPTEFELFLSRQFIEALYRPGQALDQLIEVVPIVMFLLLPLFAFGLKVLYFNKHRYYVEHLVFATHVHTVAFVAFSILVLELDDRLDGAIFVLLFLHYFLSLKRYYKDKFFSALVKFAFALFGYNLLLIPASVGIFFGTLLLV